MGPILHIIHCLIKMPLYQSFGCINFALGIIGVFLSYILFNKIKHIVINLPEKQKAHLISCAT